MKEGTIMVNRHTGEEAEIMQIETIKDKYISYVYTLFDKNWGTTRWGSIDLGKHWREKDE